MSSYIELGPSPCDEDCAQVGDEDYNKKAYKECEVWKRQLQRWIEQNYTLPIPWDFKLVVKSFFHDYGTYYEVAARFDTEAGFDLAYLIESECPKTWDDIARRELEQRE